MKFFIRNMVCDRCKMVVKAELTQLGFHPVSVVLGEADISEENLSAQQLSSLNQRFQQIGFELLEDRERQVIDQVKTAVIELIHRENGDNHIKHSQYLAQQTGRDYPYLSRLFSDSEGITIEQYIIRQKIEKVKELLTYGQLTLSEIAWQMGYSSVAAISTQFKKVTGLTPSEYKAAEDKNRKTLDRLS